MPVNHEHTPDEVVKIVKLGPSHEGKEYLAVIKGMSIDVGPNHPANIYIIEMLDAIYAPSYPFTHATFPAACIRPAVTESYAAELRMTRSSLNRFCARIPEVVVFADTPAEALAALQARIEKRNLMQDKTLKIEGAADRTSVPSSTPRP